MLFDVLKNNGIQFTKFMHTWKTDTNMVWGDDCGVPIDYEEYKLLSPDYYKIDEQDDFLNGIRFSDYYYEDGSHEWETYLIRNHLCALESMKRCTRMCISSGESFDFVIYIRPDVEIVTPFVLDAFTIGENGITLVAYDSYEGYNDKFAVVPFQRCIYYSDRIDSIAEFRKNHGRITSERYCKYTIDKYYDHVKFIDFYMNLIRPS
jgi:hypothetical protein